MARRLVATTDDTLFGDTEFALRRQALSLVADAYTEHLEKKWLRRSGQRLQWTPLSRPKNDSAWSWVVPSFQG